MLSKLKEIGNGTPHQFKSNRIFRPIPRRDKILDNQINKIIEDISEWYDISGIKYSLKKGILHITANDFFPESIVDYINAIPKECNVQIIMSVFTNSNEVAGLNMLFDTLSRIKTNRNIIIDLSDLYFGMGVALDLDNLPNNVKITSMYDKSIYEEELMPGINRSFEYWAMNLNDDNYNLLLSKLTLTTKFRISKLREIAYNFYRSVPEEIINSSSIKVKSDYIYNWCCNNISYDFSGTLSDGSFNYNRRDTQDPIVTFERRKGVCAGRARLYKILSNNYYMKIPCFIVEGMSGKLQHEWNEVILEDGTSIIYDISKQQNLSRDIHTDYKLSKMYLKTVSNNNKL